MADGVKEALESSEFQRFRELTEQMRNGTRKKWNQTNSSSEFNEEDALRRFNALMDAGFIQEHADEMKRKGVDGK